MNFLRLQLRRLRWAWPWLLALSLLAGATVLAERLRPGLVSGPVRAAWANVGAAQAAFEAAEARAGALAAEIAAAYETAKAVDTACADYEGEDKADCPELQEPEGEEGAADFAARKARMEALARRLDGLPPALTPGSLFPEPVTLTLAAGAAATFGREPRPGVGAFLLTPVTLRSGGPLAIRLTSGPPPCLPPLSGYRLRAPGETLRLLTLPGCAATLSLACGTAACAVTLGALRPPAPR